LIKRLFDIVLSSIGLLVLSPLFLIIALLLLFTGTGGHVFFRQIRIGRGGVEFVLYKFRTMNNNGANSGLLTVGMRDKRITPVGYYLRKYKLDELPQLFNVLIGDMSIVGPRPEVPFYVSKYSGEQLKVLNVRPGLTDYASIEYSNENEILGNSANPEETYLNIIMPAKLAISLKYIENSNLTTDMRIIFKTIGKILKPRYRDKKA
jgi:lipopolysaccharide/colanic/teichoic acid biosynthesis glycosyltransferase